MAARKGIDLAIEKLEAERAAFDLAIAKLREQQKKTAPKPKAALAKVSA